MLRFFCALAVLGVFFLRRLPACEAAETTERGVSATVYGGAGELREPNNESFENAYRIRRFGAGVLGVWRFANQRATSDPRELFVALGATFEVEGSHRTLCGYGCPYYGLPSPGPGQSDTTATHFAARLGAGYTFSLFEFRAGVLTAQPDRDITYAEPLWMPDVMVRFGRRRIGWFELGIGAYDASTALRPGAYLGGALGSPAAVRVSGHFGLHMPNGLCCSTVPHFGFRGELSAERAFSDSIAAGVGAAVMGELVAEGSARLIISL
jgi:hypothetical protein